MLTKIERKVYFFYLVKILSVVLLFNITLSSSVKEGALCLYQFCFSASFLLTEQKAREFKSSKSLSPSVSSHKSISQNQEEISEEKLEVFFQKGLKSYRENQFKPAYQLF